MYMNYTGSYNRSYLVFNAQDFENYIGLLLFAFSIDRLLQDTAPNRLLSFDGTGARHPGIAASGGSWVGRRRVTNLILSFDF